MTSFDYYTTMRITTAQMTSLDLQYRLYHKLVSLRQYAFAQGPSVLVSCMQLRKRLGNRRTQKVETPNAESMNTHNHYYTYAFDSCIGENTRCSPCIHVSVPISQQAITAEKPPL